MFLKQSTKIKKKCTDQGFTLLEVLIAMSIFAIGILGVASMQISAINGNASARMHTEAGTWAADRVERLMAVPYNHTDLDDSAASNPHQANEGVYTIEWTVDPPVSNTKLVRVEVKRGTETLMSLNFIKA